MAGVPSEIPAELHAAWRGWFDHYRRDGSAPRRAAEKASASVRAHYLQDERQGSAGRRVRESVRGLGVYSPERWQDLCRHCGAVAHGELTCDQASAGSLISLDRGACAVVLEDEPRPNSPEDIGGWRAA